MSQSNNRPENVFRTSLKDWQAAFRARKAQLAAILGDEAEPAPASPVREKKLSSRKRRTIKD